MSDTTPDNGQMVDRRRVLASLAAAFAVHVFLIIAFALGLGSNRTVVLPPVTIDLQAPAGPEPDASAGLPGSGGPPTSAGGPAAGASTAPSAPVAESAGAATPALPAASQSSSGRGFVIPTPRAQPIEQSPSNGSSFREAGGTTGVAKGIPSTPGPTDAPAVPPVQQGKGSGSASSSGVGASSVQRSGAGVLVPGSSGSTSGPLDLGKLDKALAGGAAGKGAARGSGASGSTGTGSDGTGGSGGTGGAAGAAGAGQNFNVLWGSPDAGKGRTLVFSVNPKIPAWVSEQGLTLSVKVSFTVLPDGVVSGATVERSSGYADVDARVIEAIRMCLFNSVPGAAPARGSIPYLINPR